MVTPSYYPIKGGTESLIRNLSIRLNEIGVPTAIMTFNMNHKWHPSWQAKEEKIDGVDVFKIPALNWFPMVHSDRLTLGVNLIPGRFRSQLRKYDVIHFHGHDLSFPLFSYTVRRPKIFHFHGFSTNFYERYFLSRLILKHIADAYISISQSMLRELVELGIPQNKITYLPNSVDIKIFRPLGVKTDNLVLFVGRISFIKGLHILLDSLAYLENPIHLVIIGPSDWDVEYFHKILKRIEDENAKGLHKITYLGAQDQEDIVRWYQRAAVFVLPSLREAFGIANLEALSCQTPVVASDVGGISEAVSNGKNGILVPPNNAFRLAKAIECLLNNEDKRNRFGQQGRKWVAENFSSEMALRKLCEIYERLTSKNG